MHKLDIQKLKFGESLPHYSYSYFIISNHAVFKTNLPNYPNKFAIIDQCSWTDSGKVLINCFQKKKNPQKIYLKQKVKRMQ